MANVTKIDDMYEVELDEREFEILTNCLVEFTNGQYAPNAAQWSLLESNAGLAPYRETRNLVTSLTSAAGSLRRPK